MCGIKIESPVKFYFWMNNIHLCVGYITCAFMYSKMYLMQFRIGKLLYQQMGYYHDVILGIRAVCQDVAAVWKIQC